MSGEPLTIGDAEKAMYNFALLQPETFDYFLFFLQPEMVAALLFLHNTGHGVSKKGTQFTYLKHGNNP